MVLKNHQRLLSVIAMVKLLFFKVIFPKFKFFSQKILPSPFISLTGIVSQIKITSNYLYGKLPYRAYRHVV